MEKIKQFVSSERGKDILTVIIVILVGLASFGLGRLSKNSQNPGIKIEYPNQSASAVSTGQFTQNTPQIAQINTNPSGKNYFASSKGKKYYSIGCSAGKTIKQENRIYFNSSEEAEKAGYTLSISCN